MVVVQGRHRISCQHGLAVQMMIHSVGKTPELQVISHLWNKLGKLVAVCLWQSSQACFFPLGLLPAQS